MVVIHQVRFFKICENNQSLLVRVHYSIDDFFKKFEICTADSQIVYGSRRKKITKIDPVFKSLNRLISILPVDLPQQHLIVVRAIDDFDIVKLEHRKVQIKYSDGSHISVNARYSALNGKFFELNRDATYVTNQKKNLSQAEVSILSFALMQWHSKSTELDPIIVDYDNKTCQISKKGRAVVERLNKDAKQQAVELIQSVELANEYTDKLATSFNGFSNLSLSINVWDSVNRYQFSNQVSKHLNSIERNFNIRDNTYRLRIEPARIVTEHGDDLFKFAGLLEWRVEIALRRLYAKRGGTLRGELYGLEFSYQEVTHELENMGNLYRTSAVIECIELLHNYKIGISFAENGKKQKSAVWSHQALSSTVLPHYIKGNNGNKHFVTFHAAIMCSINQLEFRAFDITNTHNLKRAGNSIVISNVLYTLFTNASSKTSYTTLLSELLKLAGIFQENNLRTNLQKLSRSLQALKSKIDKPMVKDFEIYPIKEFIGQSTRKTTVDYKVIIKPSESFINDIISISKAKNANILKIADQLQESDDFTLIQGF